jgi:hypothetical protein
MLDSARHVPVASQAWDAAEAQTAVDEIVADAHTRLDKWHFWPAHPLDEGGVDGDTSLYMGAAGVIWALDHLARIGATRHGRTLLGLRSRLVEVSQRHRAALGVYGLHASLHFGDFPALLVAMRLQPDAVMADLIHARASDNNALPVRELMWGLPGSMLACVFMDAMVGEARWRALFATQAKRLLDELEDTELGPLWTQDLYSSRGRYLGTVHGFAGNVIPLLRGWDWLDQEQRARVLMPSCAPSPPMRFARNSVRSGTRLPEWTGRRDFANTATVRRAW